MKSRLFYIGLTILALLIATPFLPLEASSASSLSLAINSCQLLENSGFEQLDSSGSISSWVTQSGATLTAVSDARSGSQAGRVTNTKSAWIYQREAITAGKAYEFSGFYKTESDGYYQFGLQWLNSSGSQVGDEDFVIVPDPMPNYAPFSVKATAPSGATQVEIWLYSGKGNYFRVDDLSFKQTDCTETVPATPTPPSNNQSVKLNPSSQVVRIGEAHSLNWEIPSGTQCNPNWSSETLSGNGTLSLKSHLFGRGTMTYTLVCQDSSNNQNIVSINITTIYPGETAPDIPATPTPAPTSIPDPNLTADYHIKPNRDSNGNPISTNLNSKWPSTLRAGDVVFIDPGTYTGGEITLNVEGTASNPVRILKTPGSSGKVIIDGGYSTSKRNLFRIYGAHIEIGGSQIYSNWETDFVIQRFDFAGMRLAGSANDLHIHHITFKDNGNSLGGSEGFGIRINGQNNLIEKNAFIDNASDAMQGDNLGGTNIQNLTVRQNYGYNRELTGKNWAWNAASHADFMQVQVGPASGLVAEDNLIIGFTNPFILGGSYGSMRDVTIRNNFILFESNAVSTRDTSGNIEGRWTVEQNTFVIHTRESGSGYALFLRNRDNDGEAVFSCNIMYGFIDSVGLHIDSSVKEINYDHNIRTGKTSSYSEINSSYANLGYSMGANDARTLTGISSLSGPVNGAPCTQGASFASIAEHLQLINR